MLSQTALLQLIAEDEGPLVSLYLPLDANGSANEQLKRLELALNEAEVRLATFGLSPKGSAQFLAAARAFAQEHFTLPQQESTLALLLSPSRFFTFVLPAGIPFILQVGSHFCIAPLLPALRKNAECYVLAVSKKHARLLHLHAEGVHEVEVPGMPHSFEDAMGNLEHQDKEVQSHSGGSGAMFHGQGGPKDLAKEGLDAYMHKIAKAVDHVLSGQKAPLFFVGIEEEFGMFKKYSSYPQMQQQVIPGRPDAMQTEELMEKAAEAMQPLWEKEKDVALEVYGPLAGTGRTSTDLQAILDLSYHGKVDGLLVAEGAMQWGSIRPDSGIVELHAKQEADDGDVIGLAAIHTLRHKGWVRAIPQEKMPEKAVLAAVLRY